MAESAKGPARWQRPERFTGGLLLGALGWFSLDYFSYVFGYNKHLPQPWRGALGWLMMWTTIFLFQRRELPRSARIWWWVLVLACGAILTAVRYIVLGNE